MSNIEKSGEQKVSFEEFSTFSSHASAPLRVDLQETLKIERIIVKKSTPKKVSYDRINIIVYNLSNFIACLLIAVIYYTYFSFNNTLYKMILLTIYHFKYTSRILRPHLRQVTYKLTTRYIAVTLTSPSEHCQDYDTD